VRGPYGWRKRTGQDENPRDHGKTSHEDPAPEPAIGRPRGAFPSGYWATWRQDWRQDWHRMHPICWADRSRVGRPGSGCGQHASTVRIRHDSRLSRLVTTTWLKRPSVSANQNQPATLSACSGCARRRMRPRMNSTEGSSLHAAGRQPPGDGAGVSGDGHRACPAQELAGW
jgi:hypothetical protein